MDNSSWVLIFVHDSSFFGFAGCLLLLLGVVLPAPLYIGRNGERYSVFNHFISELGEVGVSKGARIFNRCLFAAGWLFLPFAVGLGFSIGNFWAKLGMVAGIGTAVTCMLVSVFPLDQLERHLRAASSFFQSGLVTVILFTSAIWLQPAEAAVIPKGVDIIGVFSAISYSLFLLFSVRALPGTEKTDLLITDIFEHRPRFWIVPILERLVFISTVAWFLGLALALMQI
jgi:hypothetical protein